LFLCFFVCLWLWVFEGVVVGGCLRVWDGLG